MKPVKYTALFFFAVLSNGLLLASVPPPATGGNPTCWPPPCVPIDNGILFLIVAGALYGAKKIYDARKKAVTQL